MSATADHAKGAILGAIMADAATMPLHWIYDPSKIQDLLNSKGRQDSPEFYDPPSCPYYQLPLGEASPYGAETVALLHHMASSSKRVEGGSWASALAAHFRDVYKGYRNHSIKTLLANVEAGKAYPETGDSADTQANNICKVPVVVGALAGSLDLAPAVEAAVRAQQNNDSSVQYGLAAARILEKVVLGSSISQAVEWAVSDSSGLPADVQDKVAAAVEAQDKPFADAVKQFGASCAMPGALQVALVAALSASSYEEAVRTNMVAGGDNASRSIYVGALMGAAAGYQKLPGSWGAKVQGFKDMEQAADALVA